MLVSGAFKQSATRASSPGGALALLSALGWMALPASHDMRYGLCGIDLATGTHALLRLQIALTLQPARQLLVPWLLMALAMAPLLTVPLLCNQAAIGADQSQLEIQTFLVGFALVWVLAAPILVVLELGIDLLAAEIKAPPFAVAATLAVAWQASPWRRRALKLCAGSMWRSSPSGRLRGLAIGLMAGVGCLGTCWALMLAPMSIAADTRWLMALVTLFLFVERVVALRARRGDTANPFAQSSIREPVTP
jgi:predicted metal-binding membrane protein